MGIPNKGYSLLLVTVLAVSSLSLYTVESANAQTIPKPSVPEFTAKYVDHSYDVPTTYGTDPYNGQTIVTKQGEHVDNRTVEITIKNQPFTSFNDSNGNTINRFYDVRYKGSYAENWTTMFANQTQVGGIDLINPYMKQGYAVQDYFTQYTTIIYHITWQVPTNGKMDFQVEALEGYTYETSYDGHILYSYARFTFYGEESGWSNTQTVTIGEISTSPNPTQSPTKTISPTPSVPELSWLMLPLFLAVLSTTAVLILKRGMPCMGSIRKSFALFVILIMTISCITLMIVKPTDALTIAKPSIPQFTLNSAGTQSVKITIQNQPLVLSMSDESLYYNIRVKEHNSGNWTELYTNNRPDLTNLKGTIPIQSDSQSTILDYSAYGYYLGTELDFQVIAMYGYYYTQEPASHDPLVPSQTVFSVLADGESGWSPTQTLTLGQNSATATPTPTIPEFPIFVILPFFISLLLVAVYLKHRRTNHE